MMEERVDDIEFTVVSSGDDPKGKRKNKKTSSWLVKKVSKSGFKKEKKDKESKDKDPHHLTPNRKTVGDIEDIKAAALRKETKDKLKKHRKSSTLDNEIQPALPKSLQEEIQKFSMENYAENYFRETQKKKNVFTKKIPNTSKKFLQHTKTEITTSILVLNTDQLQNQAVELFIKIMYYMGDKSNNNNHIHNTLGSQSSPAIGNPVSTASLTSSGSSHFSTKSTIDMASVILSDCVTTPELRDEFYCQLIKQTTKNGNIESEEKGWELFAMGLETFLPTTTFDNYLKSYFLRVSQESHEERIKQFALCCKNRLEDLLVGATKIPKVPSHELLQYAKELPFLNSSFHDTLDGIMTKHKTTLKVPVPFNTLIDLILSDGAYLKPNIFRNASSASDILSLKLELEYNQGKLNTSGTSDRSPYVIANTLKLWLKEIRSPIIPSLHYHKIVVDTFPLHINTNLPNTDSNTNHIINDETNIHNFQKLKEILWHHLPEINKHTLIQLVSFLRTVAENKNENRMTEEGLAVVISPNLCRCPEENPVKAAEFGKYEKSFLMTLIFMLKDD